MQSSKDDFRFETWLLTQDLIRAGSVASLVREQTIIVKPAPTNYFTPAKDFSLNNKDSKALAGKGLLNR